MHEDEETTPTEAQKQEQPMEVEDDAPYLDLEGNREMQSYALIKDCEFIHMSTYDPDLHEKIGMDVEFTAIWKVVGWEDVAPFWEEGSHLLTIQFLCSLQEVENEFTFHLFKQEYFLTWKNLSSHLGFHRKCSIDLDHSLKGFNRHEFWREVFGQNIVGKFQPRNINIQHPTLGLMHCWIAMTLFPSQDIRFVRKIELQLLYAIVKKIKVAPVKDMFKHW
jgi:hypothetical protein